METKGMTELCVHCDHYLFKLLILESITLTIHNNNSSNITTLEFITMRIKFNNDFRSYHYE